MFYNLFIFEVIYRFFFAKIGGKTIISKYYIQKVNTFYIFFTFSRFFQFVLNEICSPKYIFSGFKSYSLYLLKKLHTRDVVSNITSL